ncbi:MAG: hypothetical protein KGN32_07725 [Burkholderiales bacterium]|nr:hypothetical protein [Burkholderiales bacterium]
MPLKDLPPDARPREKLLARGAAALSDAEIVAVLELPRRAMAQKLQERTVLADPAAVKHYLQLHLAARAHEVFAVLFLDTQNRLLAMEELFRGTLTQLSVTLLRKYFGWFRHFTATPSASQLWSRTPACP